MKVNEKKHPIISCVNGYWLQTFLCPLLMVGEVIFEVLIPSVMAEIINSVSSEGGVVVLAKKMSVMSLFFNNGDPVGMPFVLTAGAVMIAMSILSLGCGGLAAFLASKAGAGFAANLRQKIFYTIQNFSFFNIDKFSTASLVTRCTTDINSVQSCYLQLIRIVFRAPLMLVFAVIMAFNLHSELSVIFLIALPILAIFFMFIFFRANPLFKNMLRKYDDMNAGIQENLIGIRVVKSFVREDYERKKFNEITDNVMKAQYKAESLFVLMMPFMQLVMYACKLAIAGFGGNYILEGSLEVGDLSALITYAIQILSSLMMVNMIAVTFVMSRASVSRICELFDEKLDIVGADNDNKVQSGKIEFKNVNFSYKKGDDNYILSDINLAIQSGQTVGIIGGTGDGKSSLVQLIPRLYDVSTGEVLVDGRNVKDYNLVELRDNVAMVLQKNVLFSGTIRDNLRWGNMQATDEDIERACRQAQAWEFICSFPEGLDTDLGQGGVNVSGGQKQRLCIARALLKNPKIIILDDSTSAVDTATDEKIRAVFKQELPDVTKIIIAQRVASICNADKIVVLEQGKISDVGTHDELLQRSEIYRDVYESQAKGVAE